MSEIKKTSKSKAIISGIAWTVIQNAVNILYGLVAVPFLIRFYGKEEYGLIGLALSVNAYVTLLDMGMTNSNVRFFSEYIAKGDNEKVQKLFNLTHLFYLVIGVLNTVILVGLSFFVDRFFNITPEQTVTLRNLIWILAFNATFSWISVCFDQFLRANELIDWIKRRMTLLRLMLFLVLLCAILMEWPIEWYFFGYTFMATIILPLTIVKARRVMPSLRFGLGFDREMFRTIFPYALSLFSFGIFNFLVTSSRPLFLGNMMGAGAVAEFNVMLTITTVVTIFTTSLIQVLLPVLTKLKVTDNENGVQMIMNQGTKYVTAFVTMLILVLVISAPEILTLYVGEEYASLGPWLIVWLLTLLLSHRNVMTALVFTEKKLKPVTIMGAVAMLAAMVGYVILVPLIGVGGVVVGWSIHEIIHTLFYYFYFLPDRFKINTRQVFVKSVLPSWLYLGVAAILVYVLALFVDTTCLWSAVIKTAVSGILFGVLVWFVIFNGGDRKFVLSFISRKK